MDFNRYASDFVRAGYHLAALAVDPLHRSAKLHLQLDLAFPLLCDPRREVVRAWDLYNPRERGGIAVPATVLLDNHAHIRFLAREAMASRLRASDLLAYASGGRTTAPVPHGFWPRTRDWWRALFH